MLDLGKDSCVYEQWVKNGGGEQRRNKTKLWEGGASRGIVMTATHCLPDISNWLTLCLHVVVQLAEPAWIVPAISLNICQKDLNEVIKV